MATSVSKIPTSRLEALQKRYRTRELPNGLGWSAWVKDFDYYGQSWGATEADALASIDWFVKDNHCSKDVVLGMAE